jgi:hypothetical protein
MPSANQHTFPKVIVIVLTHKNFDDLSACIISLRKSDYPNFTTIIVDNNSDYVEKIRASFPEAILIANSSNIGPAKANNIGIDRALQMGAEYLFFLNDDTLLPENCLSSLVEALSTLPDAGSVQPLILKSYDATIVDSAGQELHSKGGGEDITVHDGSTEIREILGPCNAVALYRAKVFQDIGKYDESFFFIHEDTDYSIRMRLAGYQCYLVPTTIAYHKRTLSSREHHSNPYLAFLGGRNAFILSLRYWPLRYLILYFPLYVKRYLDILHWLRQSRQSFGEFHKQLWHALGERRQYHQYPTIREFQKKWIVKKGYRYLLESKRQSK